MSLSAEAAMRFTASSLLDRQAARGITAAASATEVASLAECPVAATPESRCNHLYATKLTFSYLQEHECSGIGGLMHSFALL